MANNRLYLKCGKCGKVHILARYYRGTSWHLGLGPGGTAGLDVWLLDHSHGDDNSCGPTHFSLEYEESTPKLGI